MKLERSQLEQHRRELERTIGRHLAQQPAIPADPNAVISLASLLNEGELSQRKALLRQFIKCIEVHSHRNVLPTFRLPAI